MTAPARAIAKERPTGRQIEVVGAWPDSTPRVPLADSLDPRRGKRAVNIKGRGLRGLLYGRKEIDLSAVSQLVDEGQVLAIGRALDLARQRYVDGERSLPEIVEAVMREIAHDGLDALDRRTMGDYVAFRPYELAAALNRLRSLKIKS